MGDGSLSSGTEVRGSTLMQTLVVDDSAVYRKLIGDHCEAGISASPGGDGLRSLANPGAKGCSQARAARLGAA